MTFHHAGSWGGQPVMQAGEPDRLRDQAVAILRQQVERGTGLTHSEAVRVLGLLSPRTPRA